MTSTQYLLRLIDILSTDSQTDSGLQPSASFKSRMDVLKYGIEHDPECADGETSVKAERERIVGILESLKSMYKMDMSRNAVLDLAIIKINEPV